MIKSTLHLSTKKYTVSAIQEVIMQDLNHIWHPCSQMKDFETMPPFVVHKAQGAYLYTDHGKLIDGISSWWCKSLGHRHPAVLKALENQLQHFEHVIAATSTHPALAALGEKLAYLTHKQHVFFASDGSSAVEIALKLTLHAQQIQGTPQRKKFIALKNGYHGETLGALSVSDIGKYKKPYEGYGVDCYFIKPPYVNSTLDPLWDNADEPWQRVLPQLEAIKDEVCAVILEPLIQGASGMRLYSKAFLKQLASWAKANHIYLIADEIMTGLGRTGAWLACNHAEIEPDLICLSKGLTAGALPLSCVLIDHVLFSLFYQDYALGHSFLHSHTHSANALAVCTALAVLNTLETENINQKATALGKIMQAHMQEIANKCGVLSNVRAFGAIVAADLQANGQDRIGFKFYQKALSHGALLRPIGNTLYWLPPLNCEEHTIVKLAEITLHSIEATYC